MIRQNSTEQQIRILQLRMKAIDLSIRSLWLGYDSEHSELKALGEEISVLFKSLKKYDFISRISSGTTLFVGEGNLSFAYAIAQEIPCLHPIVASTYEEYDDLSLAGKQNAGLLKRLGIQVLHGINATTLQHYFGSASFDTIIFQFPNAGSREPVEGHNPNYILVRDFLLSASQVLRDSGSVVITTVDSDYYNNIFKFQELATQTPFQQPIQYVFDPDDYPDYEHTMTHMEVVHWMHIINLPPGSLDYAANAAIRRRKSHGRSRLALHAGLHHSRRRAGAPTPHRRLPLAH